MFTTTVRRHAICILIALLLALAPAAYVAFTTNNSALEIRLTLPEASWLHLYPDNGSGFHNTHYQSSKYVTPGKPATLRFPLGPRRLHAFRLHIATVNGEASLSDIRVVNSGLAAPIPLSPELFRLACDEHLTAVSGTLLATPLTGSTEATITGTFATPLSIPASVHTTIQSILSAYLRYALLFYGVALFAGWGIRACRFEGVVTSDRQLRAMIATALFAVIFASRLWFARHYGPTLPFWDQWVVEINQLYLPYVDLRFADMDFIGPVNGHRLLISRLLMFGLFLIKGSFSTHLQMLCGAMLISCLAAGFYLAATRVVKGSFSLLLGLFVTILFTLPFDWENRLWGLTGPQLLLVLSVAALWCVTHYQPPSKGWYAGAILGFCAIMEMGSGFLVISAPAIVILFSLRSHRSERALKSHLALFLAWGGAGLANYLMIPASHYAVELKAPSLDLFLLALAKFLAWPLPFLPWWAVCQWLPFMLLLFRSLNRKHGLHEESDPDVIMFILATGFWILLQAAAIAYGRGATAPSPASRYTDILAVGVAVNISCLFLVTQAGYRTTAQRIFNFLAAYCWLGGVIVGLTLATVYDMSIAIPQKKLTSIAQLENIRNYLSAKDPATLYDKPFYDVPYENPAYLFPILDNKNISRILPGIDTPRQ